MVGGDIARDREEPGLKRTPGFVSVPRLVERHKYFLVNILELVGICNPRAQEPGDGRTNIIQQNPAGVTITVLHAPHQAHPQLASLHPRGAIHLVSFVRHG